MMRGYQFLRSGFSYLIIGDYDQALNAFAKAIAEDPENPAYAFHGSMTAWRSGHYDLAQEWAENAVKLEPDNQLYTENLRRITAQYLLEQAKTAQNEGRNPQAQELINQALKTDPLNDQALRMQENIYLDQGVNDV
jgi:uncharacterized protein HemY